jgi:hypothetical protein
MLEKAMTFLAFLGAVLVYTVAQLLLPDTTAGRIAAFLIYGAALYPVARVLWFGSLPAWRYPAGLAVGAAILWCLEVWRRGISPEANIALGWAAFGFATAGLLYTAWRRLSSLRRR